MHRAPDRLLAELDQFGGKLGLEAIRGLLEALGNPQEKVPSVVIAGTNGKGSTASLLAAIATAAGYRTGLYTSPHLERPEERLRIEGQPIPSNELALLLEEVVSANRKRFGVLPSYFEALTACARLWFARAGCELAVMEVGLGGRLDATNVGDGLLQIITEISYDHERILGERLEEIALEKAGVMRPGREVLLWGEPPEAFEALCQRAEELGSPFTNVTATTDAELMSPPQELPARVHLRTAKHEYDLETRLLGVHQLPNLRLAVVAAERLASLGFERMDPGSVQAGIKNCHWPGRLEHIDIGGGRTVVLDGGHNQGAARALAVWLDDLSRGDEARGPQVDLLFAALERKRVATVLPQLASRARKVVLTDLDTGQAHPPEYLARLISDHADVSVLPGPSAALDHAISEMSQLLLICGSLYLVGDLRKVLRARYGVPKAIVPEEPCETAKPFA